MNASTVCLMKEKYPNSVLLCAGLCLNHVGKYIMIFESSKETRSTDQSPGDLESAPTPGPQATEGEQSRAWRICSMLSLRGPQHCHDCARALNNNSQTITTRLIHIECHLTWMVTNGTQQAAQHTHRSSCQQSLWRPKTLRFKSPKHMCSSSQQQMDRLRAH